MRWDDETTRRIAEGIAAREERRAVRRRQERRYVRLDVAATGFALVAFTVAVATLSTLASAVALVALVVCLIVASAR